MTRQPIVLRPDGPPPRLQARAWVLLAPRLPRPVRRLLARGLARLAPGSRLRSWALVRASQHAWDATGRNDHHQLLALWEPDCEWHWDQTFGALGFEAVYRGHDGVERSLDAWSSIWSERDFTLREVLDGGDTFITTVLVSTRGSAGGVPTQAESHAVVRLDPLIRDFRVFYDRDDALRAAGFTDVD